jgi:hypothetical protein
MRLKWLRAITEPITRRWTAQRSRVATKMHARGIFSYVYLNLDQACSLAGLPEGDVDCDMLMQNADAAIGAVVKKIREEVYDALPELSPTCPAKKLAAFDNWLNAFYRPCVVEAWREFEWQVRINQVGNGDLGSWCSIWRLLGYALPRNVRYEAFEPACADLVADYFETKHRTTATFHLWIGLWFTVRTVIALLTSVGVWLRGGVTFVALRTYTEAIQLLRRVGHDDDVD